MPQVYDADTGEALQVLKLLAIGRHEWVSDALLAVWAYDLVGMPKERGPSPSARSYPREWLFMLHATEGVVAQLVSASPASPLAVLASAGEGCLAGSAPGATAPAICINGDGCMVIMVQDRIEMCS